MHATAAQDNTFRRSGKIRTAQRRLFRDTGRSVTGVTRPDHPGRGPITGG
jgi:hypothetical protein